ncbi:hypothetical protein U1Q18_044526 [Sarracenia purpurea var. burkii]
MVGVAAAVSIWEGGISSVIGISSGLGLAAATPTDISYVLHGYWLLPPLLPLQILHLQTLHMRYMVAYGECGVLGLWVGCVAVSVWMRGGRRLSGCSFWGVDGCFFWVLSMLVSCRCSSLQLGIAAAFSPIAVICICYMAGLPLIEMSFLVPFCF